MHRSLALRTRGPRLLALVTPCFLVPWLVACRDGSSAQRTLAPGPVGVATAHASVQPPPSDDVDMPASCAGLGPDDECFEQGPQAVRLDALEHAPIIKSVEVLADRIIVILENASAPTPPFLQVNHTVFGGRRAGRPFLRKIVRVARNRAALQLFTVRASIHDAFSKLRIKRSVRIPVPVPDRNHGTATKSRTSARAVELATVDCHKDLIDDPTNGLYVGIPQCTFTPELTVEADIHVSNGATTTFKLGMGLGAELDFAWLAELSQSYTQEVSKSIVNIPIPILSIGVLSLGLEFDISVGASIDFDARAAVSAGYKWTAALTAGVEYKDGALSPYVEKDSTSTLDGPYIDFQGSAYGELWIKPSLSITADATVLIAGASADIGVGAKLFAYGSLAAQGGCRNQTSAGGPEATTGIYYDMGIGIQGQIVASADMHFLWWGPEVDKSWPLGEQRWSLASDVYNLPIGQCCDAAGCPDIDRCTVATGCRGNTCEYRSLTGECCRSDGDCDDRNECTTDSCDRQTGQCSHKLKPACKCSRHSDCSDGNACTLDRCDIHGLCVFSRIPGCQSCTRDSECDDSNACTLDQCSSDGKCVYAPHQSQEGCCLGSGDCASPTACKASTCENYQCVTYCKREDGDCSTCCERNDDCGAGGRCIVGYCARVKPGALDGIVN